jgi:hypothetical protein
MIRLHLAIDLSPTERLALERTLDTRDRQQFELWAACRVRDAILALATPTHATDTTDHSGPPRPATSYNGSDVGSPPRGPGHLHATRDAAWCEPPSYRAWKRRLEQYPHDQV